MAELREALRTQRPSLELQRAAADEIARLDAIVASTRDQAARDALLRIGEAAKSAGWKDGDLIEFVAGKLGQPSEAQKPDRWMIRYNEDGEFGQTTGWLYRDGGHPCIVTGKPVWVWRPLSDLLAKTGHQVTRPAAQPVQVQVPGGGSLVPGWNWLIHPDWNDGEPTPAWVEVDGGYFWYMPVDIQKLPQFAWEDRDDAWEVAAAPLPPAQPTHTNLDPNESDPIALWAEICRLREAIQGPDGYETWQQAATAERARRVKAERDACKEPVNRRLLEALRYCIKQVPELATVPGVNCAIAEAEAQQAAQPQDPVVAVCEHREEPRGCYRVRCQLGRKCVAEAQQAAQPVGRESLSKAAQDVLAERRRQVEVEGWTPEHDDEHGQHELAHAAACYAYPELTCLVGVKTWPWDEGSFKVKDQRFNYVRAAALLLASIERLDRVHGITGEGA